MRIDDMISAAVFKGTVTTEERQAILQEAQKWHLDTYEIDLQINALLYERKKNIENALSVLRANKFGTVCKCPVCGGRLQMNSGVCMDCNYVMDVSPADFSMEELKDKLKKLEMETVEKMTAGGDESKFEKKRIAASVKLIQSMPIPNTKDELLEFLGFLSYRMSDVTCAYREAKACYVKYVQCIYKIKLLFPDDLNCKWWLERYDLNVQSYRRAALEQRKYDEYGWKTYLLVLGILLGVVYLIF